MPSLCEVPTVELASGALLQVHGVVLKEKPLIVVSALINWVGHRLCMSILTLFHVVPSAFVKPKQTRNEPADAVHTPSSNRLPFTSSIK